MFKRRTKADKNANGYSLRVKYFIICKTNDCISTNIILIKNSVLLIVEFDFIEKITRVSYIVIVRCYYMSEGRFPPLGVKSKFQKKIRTKSEDNQF